MSKHGMQESDWHEGNGLCDCFSGGHCLKGWCCPCLLLNKTHDMLENPDQEPSECGAVGCGWCLLNMCGGWGFILGCLQRGKIRQKYQIDGSSCGDFCANGCLPCCAIIQQHKEVEMRVKEKAASNVPYQRQPQMRAPGQY